MAVVVFVAYGLWLASFFAAGHDPRDLIYIGTRFIEQSHVSQVIKPDPAYPNVSQTGYDGQFFYYLALDPVNARYYMDFSTYRYTRILYPMTARALAFGQPALIPWTLWLINWLAIGGGTLALAAWLRRKGWSPWFAAIFGFYPGLEIALQRDLSEALGYGLAAVGVFLFNRAGGRRWLLPAVVFALAALTRESTAIFALGYAAALLLDGGEGGELRARIGRNWVSAVGFGAVALVPLIVYKAFLLAWLGAAHDVGIPLAHLPFQGLLHWRDLGGSPRMEVVRSVVIPGLIAGAVAAYGLGRRRWQPEVWLLLANVAVFIVFLQADAFVAIEATSRITTGVVLAAVLALPALAAVAGRAWLWVCAALWLSLVPFWLVLPTLHNLRLALHG